MSKIRLHIYIKGAIQGVGFRPFIFRLAEKFEVNGYVCNSSSGVVIEGEGQEKNLREFLFAIGEKKPSLAIITSLEYSFLDPVGFISFTIKESEKMGDVSALILPDISTCSDCQKELFDSANRRYLYPFINCTNCGPRFSIIKSLPYDRKNTSMKKFEMCEECKEEYNDPLNRRFHAEPIACNKCGPQLELWNSKGKVLADKNYALFKAAEQIYDGKIIALKGIGGFQLIVDASNDDTIKRLRLLKHRDEKPFALMFPSLEKIKEICELSVLEERVITSPESPIVILSKKNWKNDLVSTLVAPGNPNLGVMLPYSPLHLHLMRQLNFPIVATSGNISEEPICIDEYEALKRLNGTADYFLVHNRPIVRHVDDSIVRVAANREMVLRRARGFAPLPISLMDAYEYGESLIAFGGHLKNTIALKKKEHIFISQHIGDLSTEESNKAFRKVIKDFQDLYEIKPNIVLCDLHPDYFSTKYAEKSEIPIEKIQHHISHIAACRIENQVKGEALGVSWDGTGYGPDDTIWGGEFFYSDDISTIHIGQFRKFPLPGGEAAIKESRRSALGVIYELSKMNHLIKFEDILLKIFLPNELELLIKMLEQKINSPLTSSVGRLFDAVSSMLMLRQSSSFEGQAAMQLEFAADKNTNEYYPFDIRDREVSVADWQTTFEALIDDNRKGINPSVISSKFHNTLVEIIYSMAGKFNLKKVILSGGCFQNVILLERTVERLESKSIKVYWHQRIPPNDGSISVGQIAEYLRRRKYPTNSNYKNLNNECRTTNFVHGTQNAD